MSQPETKCEAHNPARQLVSWFAAPYPTRSFVAGHTIPSDVPGSRVQALALCLFSPIFSLDSALQMIAVAVASLLVGTASAAPAVNVGGFDCDTCKLVGACFRTHKRDVD